MSLPMQGKMREFVNLCPFHPHCGGKGRESGETNKNQGWREQTKARNRGTNKGQGWGEQTKARDRGNKQGQGWGKHPPQLTSVIALIPPKPYNPRHGGNALPRSFCPRTHHRSRDDRNLLPRSSRKTPGPLRILRTALELRSRTHRTMPIRHRKTDLRKMPRALLPKRDERADSSGDALRWTSHDMAPSLAHPRA